MNVFSFNFYMRHYILKEWKEWNNIDNNYLLVPESHNKETFLVLYVIWLLGLASPRSCNNIFIILDGCCFYVFKGRHPFTLPHKKSFIAFLSTANQFTFEILKHETTKSWKNVNSLVISGILRMFSYLFYRTQLYWSLQLLHQSKNTTTREIKQRRKKKFLYCIKVLG